MEGEALPEGVPQETNLAIDFFDELARGHRIRLAGYFTNAEGKHIGMVDLFGVGLQIKHRFHTD